MVEVILSTTCNCLHCRWFCLPYNVLVLLPRLHTTQSAPPTPRNTSQSRYIESLLDKAVERKREQDIRYERQLLKEREAEDHLFGDKDKFVTAAYRRKLEEDKLWQTEQKKRCVVVVVWWWLCVVVVVWWLLLFHSSPLSLIFTHARPLRVCHTTLKHPPHTQYTHTHSQYTPPYTDNTPTHLYREAEEAANDVTRRGHMGDFYRNLMSNNVAFGGAHAAHSNATANTYVGTCGMLRGLQCCLVLHTTCHTHHATHNIPHAPCHTQHASVYHATNNMPHTTYHTQHATHNIPHTTYHKQHASIYNVRINVHIKLHTTSVPMVHPIHSTPPPHTNSTHHLHTPTLHTTSTHQLYSPPPHTNSTHHLHTQNWWCCTLATTTNKCCCTCFR